MASFVLSPDVASRSGDLEVGDVAERCRDLILLGTLSESGPKRKLWLDISGEQVVAVFGKRGTGKSYTLGVLLEGLASGPGAADIARLESARAGLVLDIMGIYWTSQIPLSRDGPPEVQKQAAGMVAAGLHGRRLAVEVWVPDGFQLEDIDPPGVHRLTIQASQMDLDDWGALFGLDIFGEPRGMLIADLLRKVSSDGYTNDKNEEVLANAGFHIRDMLLCLDEDPTLQVDYRDDTRRSIRQRLSTFASLELFSGAGTPLTDLLRAGNVSVLMLNRLPDELKEVVVAVLARQILRNRGRASFAQKRLDLDSDCSDEERHLLEQCIEGSVPRSWILLDEAQVLAGQTEGSVAREMLVKYAKEGRNYGLSLAIATQQPSALDKRLTSQVETLVTHQLTSPDDAAVAVRAMRSPVPESVTIDGSQASLDALIRRVGQGEAVFSSGSAPSLPRCVTVKVRPRITAHGGYEA
jgi:DNA helicase HerA-like ATPase